MVVAAAVADRVVGDQGVPGGIDADPGHSGAVDDVVDDSTAHRLVHPRILGTVEVVGVGVETDQDAGTGRVRTRPLPDLLNQVALDPDVGSAALEVETRRCDVE